MSDNSKAFESITAAEFDKTCTVMDCLIEQDLNFSRALAYCTKKMILSGDITTDEYKSMDPVLSSLVQHSQELLRVYLDLPAYDHYTDEKKEHVLESEWSKKIPSVLLMNQKVEITDIPLGSFTRAIGDDKKTGRFYNDLTKANRLLRDTLLVTYGYYDEELPMQRIVDVVNILKNDGNLIDDIPFHICFQETLLEEVPHPICNNLEALASQ